MIKHMAIKAGIGLGLMAASLGVNADLHTFGKQSIYYKVTGSRVDYAAFLPSGNQQTDSVIMLDVLQSSTISTWNYAVGGGLNLAAAISGVNSASTSTITNSTGGGASGFSNFSGPAGGQVWKATGVVTSYAQDGSIGTLTLSTFYGGDTRALSLSFTEVVTASSQACNMTFHASLDTNDYLQFTNVTVQPSGWPSATAGVSYRTKSGTVAGDTASIASNVFNDYNAAGGTSSFYTFSAWSIPLATAAGNTVAVSALSTPFNKCNAPAVARTATNSAGNTIGGKGGMMRLW